MVGATGENSEKSARCRIDYVKSQSRSLLRVFASCKTTSMCSRGGGCFCNFGALPILKSQLYGHLVSHICSESTFLRISASLSLPFGQFF